MVLSCQSLLSEWKVSGKVKEVETHVYTWIDYKIILNKADMLKLQYQMKGMVKLWQNCNSMTTVKRRLQVCRALIWHFYGCVMSYDIFKMLNNNYIIQIKNITISSNLRWHLHIPCFVWESIEKHIYSIYITKDLKKASNPHHWEVRNG